MPDQILAPPDLTVGTLTGQGGWLATSNPSLVLADTTSRVWRDQTANNDYANEKIVDLAGKLYAEISMDFLADVNTSGTFDNYLLLSNSDQSVVLGSLVEYAYSDGTTRFNVLATTQQLNFEHFACAQNVWHNLKVVVDGLHTLAFLDNVLIGSLCDTPFLYSADRIYLEFQHGNATLSKWSGKNLLLTTAATSSQDGFAGVAASMTSAVDYVVGLDVGDTYAALDDAAADMGNWPNNNLVRLFMRGGTWDANTVFNASAITNVALEILPHTSNTATVGALLQTDTAGHVIITGTLQVNSRSVGLTAVSIHGIQLGQNDGGTTGGKLVLSQVGGANNALMLAGAYDIMVARATNPASGFGVIQAGAGHAGQITLSNIGFDSPTTLTANRFSIAITHAGTGSAYVNLWHISGYQPNNVSGAIKINLASGSILNLSTTNDIFVGTHSSYAAYGTITRTSGVSTLNLVESGMRSGTLSLPAMSGSITLNHTTTDMVNSVVPATVFADVATGLDILTNATTLVTDTTSPVSVDINGEARPQVLSTGPRVYAGLVNAVFATAGTITTTGSTIETGATATGTVTLNDDYAGTITLADNKTGSTFAHGTITSFSVGTFTITPTVAGTHTLSASSSPTLTITAGTLVVTAPIPLGLFNDTFTNGFIAGQTTADATWINSATPSQPMIVQTASPSQILINQTSAIQSQAFCLFASQNPTLTLTGAIYTPTAGTGQKYISLALIDNATDLNYLADVAFDMNSANPFTGRCIITLQDNAHVIERGTVNLSGDAFQTFTLSATPTHLTFTMGTLTLDGNTTVGFATGVTSLYVVTHGTPDGTKRSIGAASLTLTAGLPSPTPPATDDDDGDDDSDLLILGVI